MLPTGWFAVLGLALLAGTAGCGGGPTTPAPIGSSSGPAAGPGPTARVLVVTHTTGFRHSSNDVAEPVLDQLGRSTGAFQTSFCRTAADVRQLLTISGLAAFDAVIFANTTGDLGIPDLQGFLDWVASGRGFAAMHSAADTYHSSPGYLEMLGNEFDRHGNETEVEAVVEMPSHQAVAHLAPRYRVFDEIYRFTSNNRLRVIPLLTLDRAPADGLPDAGQLADLPLAWVKPHGAGRVFYTALGHRDELWRDPQYQRHVLGGILWVLGR
jgi:type 1 glutamine amidotransferase